MKEIKLVFAQDSGDNSRYKAVFSKTSERLNKKIYVPSIAFGGTKMESVPCS